MARSGTGPGFAACAAAVLTGFVAFAPAPAAQLNSDLAQATEVLRASIDEWKREESAYRALSGSDKIPSAEQEAYAVYVAGLRLRVLEQCEVVRHLGGEAAVAPFECVRTGPKGGQLSPAATVPPAAVLTDEEKKAAIRARLTEIEGEIDESLRKRQQEVRRTAAVPGSVRSGETGGSQGATSGASSGGTVGGGALASSGSQSKPSGETSGRGGSAGREVGSDGSAIVGAARPPSPGGKTGRSAAVRQRPTDDGVDDDIVARQLREAAEKEADPVLKEKLWAEYRKYKEAKK